MMVIVLVMGQGNDRLWEGMFCNGGELGGMKNDVIQGLVG